MPGGPILAEVLPSDPTFSTVTITSLTALRLVASNSLQALVSVANLQSWIDGTANQVITADNGDGSITLSLPQSIDTGASPTFANLLVSGTPRYRLIESGATANNGHWDFTAAGEAFGFRGLNDAENAVVDVMLVQRTGQTIDSITFGGPVDMATAIISNIGATGTDFVAGGGLNLAGPLNMSNQIISNIGVAGTDFGADGSLTLAGAITVTAGQINFPATQNPSAGANVLDDYRESDYTPTGNGVTLTNNGSTYVKIGKIVCVHIDVTWPSTANADPARISLPFAVAAGRSGSLAIGYSDNANALTFRCEESQTYGVVHGLSGANITNNQVSTNRFRMGGSYIATA